MSRNTNKSICRLCGLTFSQTGITRHLSSCLNKTLKNHPLDSNSDYLHLLVKAVHRPEYFLHLLVSERLTLKALDDYLRQIWLECCGHMSSFWSLPNQVELRKNLVLTDVFSPVNQLYYEYDFGDTTALTIDCKGNYTSTTDLAGPIVLLSRNSNPAYPCDECEDGSATVICVECEWDSGGFLCQKCADHHPCDSDCIMPISNSPRFGVCGYMGDDEIPEENIFLDQALISQAKKAPKTNKKKSDASDKQQRLRLIEAMIRRFYDDFNTLELAVIAIELLDTMEETKTLNLYRGSMDIWAAATVYTIAQINGQFYSSHPLHCSADHICNHFNVNKATVASKARLIEHECNLDWDTDGYEFDEIGLDLEDFNGLLPGNSEVMNILSSSLEAALSSSISEDTESLRVMLTDALKEGLKDFFPKGAKKEVVVLQEQLIEDLIDDFLNSLIDETFPEGRARIQQESDEEKLANQKEKQQQKIVDQEKDILDKGQLTIFD